MLCYIPSSFSFSYLIYPKLYRNHKSMDFSVTLGGQKKAIIICFNALEN
jgi:hypothetical protein